MPPQKKISPSMTWNSAWHVSTQKKSKSFNFKVNHPAKPLDKPIYKCIIIHISIFPIRQASQPKTKKNGPTSFHRFLPAFRTLPISLSVGFFLATTMDTSPGLEALHPPNHFPSFPVFPGSPHSVYKVLGDAAVSIMEAWRWLPNCLQLHSFERLWVQNSSFYTYILCDKLLSHLKSSKSLYKLLYRQNKP